MKLQHFFIEKFGFTLIELLVVVLIVGILASISLPLYQRAVRKAQMTQVFVYLDSLAKAQEVYYMANGQYSIRFEELDWGFPCQRQATDDGAEPSDKCYFSFSAVGGAFKINRKWVLAALFPDNNVAYRLHCYRTGSGVGQLNSTAFFVNNPGKTSCFASGEDKEGNGLLQSLGGKLRQTHPNAGFCNKAPCLEYEM